MVPSHRKVRSGRDEFRETLTVRADGNPEPSRRYTAGRCRDYLSAAVALNDRLELPAPLWGEEIVHSLRKRRGSSESLGPRFESERAHHPNCRGARHEAGVALRKSRFRRSRRASHRRQLFNGLFAERARLGRETGRRQRRFPRASSHAERRPCRS
jgi:hypothetical protein